MCDLAKARYVIEAKKAIVVVVVAADISAF
jgi:hypothetical protein